LFDRAKFIEVEEVLDPGATEEVTMRYLGGVKRGRGFAFALSLVLLFLSPTLRMAGSPLTNSPAAPDYFPQALGNEWVYVRTGLGRSQTTWTNQVVEVAPGRWHHTNYWGDGHARWLTENEAGDVFESLSDSQQNLWYKFSAGPAEAWTMAVSSGAPPCTSGAELTIMGFTHKVEVPAGVFANCLMMAFRTACRDAGITAEWFAPGVGLVKRTETSFAGEVTTVLQSARIHTMDNLPAKVKVEFGLDQLEYSYNLMPPVPPLIPGPVVHAEITLVNNSGEEIRLSFRSSQRYDFILEDQKGRVVFKWSADKAFLTVLGQEVVKPGGSLSYTVAFSLPDSTVGIIPEGIYTMRGIITSENPYSGSMPVKIIHAR